MSRYQLVEYVDVVENEDGTFGITEVAETDFFIEIDSKTVLKDVCKELKNQGVLPSVDMRKISVSDLDSDIIEFKLKKEKKPICRLVKRKYI